MTEVRIEDIEPESSDAPENAPQEAAVEAPAPKKRGRPLGSKDKQKRAQRASTTYNPLEPEPDPVPKKIGRPLGAKDRQKRAPRGASAHPEFPKSSPEPPESPSEPPERSPGPPVPSMPMSYQEQKRAYLRQLDQARAADFNARAQHFGALLAKRLPY